jgi:hypothetical protein
MVPPSMSGTPRRRQSTLDLVSLAFATAMDQSIADPKYAEASATLRSHQRASSNPPATAGPETAAITGFESCIRVTLYSIRCVCAVEFRGSLTP